MSGAHDLRISVRRTREDRELRFTNIRTGSVFIVSLTRGVEKNIEAWRRELPTLLAPFHEKVSELRTTGASGRWAQIAMAVDRLRDISQEFLDQLAGTRAADLQDFLTGAIPRPWEARDKPARIQMLVDESHVDLLTLPIEYLPVGRIPVRQSIRDPASLQRALAMFAGFAAIVVHRADEPTHAHNILTRKTNGRVPAQIVAYDGFTQPYKSTSEAIWLSSKIATCEIEPLWPDHQTDPDEATDALARIFFDPRYRLRDALTEPEAASSAVERSKRDPDQIQHISCHYYADTRRFKLRDAAPDIWVSLTGIRGKVTGMRTAAPRREGAPGPFVFLNACASGAAPHDLKTLVETLLFSTPTRAVLATETEVDFHCAAQFARCVYAEIFRGRSLGEAVHRARWELIFSDDNPFGILYTLYGDPTLHLERHVHS